MHRYSQGRVEEGGRGDGHEKKRDMRTATRLDGDRIRT